MTGRLACCLAVLVVLQACEASAPSVPGGTDLASVLPDLSALGNWRIVEGPTVFTADNLWEYLDGGAPRYVEYGLEKMVHVRYQLGDDLLSSIVVDVFDMTTELGAFGIYRSIRPSEADARPWGVEGYLSQTVAAAWKGTVFVHAAADDDRSELVRALESTVAQVCAAVGGEASEPAVLDPLPPSGLVPHSERWVAGDLLGHAALGGGVLATYEIEGRSGELFFSELADETEAAVALQSLREEMGRWADISELHGGRTGFRLSHPDGRSGIVVRAGRFIAGVSGDLTFDEEDDLLGSLSQRLREVNHSGSIVR